DGRNFAWSLSRGFDVDRIPAGAKSTSDSRSDANDARRFDVRTHTYHHSLGDEGRFQAFTLSMRGRLFAHLVGHGAQRQLPQCREVGFTEEIRECLLDLVWFVHLALT